MIFGKNIRTKLLSNLRSSSQVADLLAHLDKKKGRGIDAVTAVRVSADDRETQRRMAEERARQERLQRLQVGYAIPRQQIGRIVDAYVGRRCIPKTFLRSGRRPPCDQEPAC